MLLAARLATSGACARSANLRATWGKVLRDPAALCAAIVLVAVRRASTMLDSVHFRRVAGAAPGAAAGATGFYAPTHRIAARRWLLARQIATRETTYSRPLAYEAFIKEPIECDGKSVRDFPRLKFGGAHLKDPTRSGPATSPRRVLGRPRRRRWPWRRWRVLLAALPDAPRARRHRAARCATSPPTAPTSRCAPG